MLAHYNQTNIDVIRDAYTEARNNGPVYESIRDVQRALSYFRDHALSEGQSLFWGAVEIQDLMGDGRYI